MSELNSNHHIVNFTTSPYSEQVPALLQSHFDQLHAGSGISVEVIRERGCESVLGHKRLADLGFSKAQQRVPGLLSPGWSVDGQQIPPQYKPDRPRLDRRGRSIKYETPKGAANRVDCLPRCQKKLADPAIPLYVVEGKKKGDCLATQGLCVIDIAGVWTWKSRNELKGITISADFDHIAFNDRVVYLMPDSDIATIPGVRQASLRLAEHLRRKKAKVSIIYLPQEGTQKVGVDDYLVAGHTLEELIQLAVEPEEEVAEEKQEEIYSNYVYCNNKLHLEVRKLDSSYAFACLGRNGKVQFVPEVVAGDITMRPRPLPVSREGRTVYLVEMPDENIASAPLLSPAELYRALDAHFRKYIDLADLDIKLCIYYCLFTWFYRKVNTLGYLRFLADTGKGKSRIQKVISDECYYPVKVTGASSLSGTFRQQEKWKGTLSIDESDFWGDKESHFTKYLNCGFEKDKPFVLSDKLDPKKQEFFDPFSPKILAMREPFSDMATEGRVLSLSPHETANPDIPIILKSNYGREAGELRNKMARFALEHWDEIDGEKMVDFRDLGIEPRLQQLAMPLSIIFQVWPEGIEPFKGYLLQRQQEIRRVRSQSWEGSLFNVVLGIASGDVDLMEEYVKYYVPSRTEPQAVTPSMVARQMNAKARSVTMGLTKIGFEVQSKAIAFYKEDKPVKDTVVRAYTVPDQKTWDEMVSRYYSKEDDKQELNPEVPEILRSKRFLCGEASKPSKPSKNAPETEKIDTLDTLDALQHRVKKEEKEKLPSPVTLHLTDGRVVSWDWCLTTWHKLGRPLIHAGDNDNIFDLSLFLYPEKLSANRLAGIVGWLEAHVKEKMPEPK